MTTKNYNESERHLPFFQFIQAIQNVKLDSYFHDYKDGEICTLMSGFMKAFREYYCMRLTRVLFDLRGCMNLWYDDENRVQHLTNDELGVSISVEYFIVFIQVLMDQSAFYIPFFYPNTNIQKLIGHQLTKDGIRRYKTFSQIKHAIVKRKEIDYELASYFENNIGWFEKINNIRNGLIHGAVWLWLEPISKTGDYLFRDVSGLLYDRAWNNSLIGFVATSYYYFCQYLRFLEDHLIIRAKKIYEDFEHEETPHWFTPNSSFYRSMDYFEEKGRELLAGNLKNEGS